MYNPQRYKSEDHQEAFELMDRYPFATVIAVVDGKPFISHLPLTLRKSDEETFLIGHVARANPHSKILKNSQTTVLFHGPHTYITPKWYVENDVPTWNYSTVHVTGSVELIENDDDVIQCLKELTNHVEKHWPSGWEFFIPEDLSGKALSKSIVGFKIKIEEIQYKKKLSQNRTPEDRSGVLRGLAERTDDQSREILTQMRELYLENGNLKS